MEPFAGLFGTTNSSSHASNRARAMSFSGQYESNGNLPPEVEEGNIEYKLKLVNPSNTRFEHLVTQMKWRLQEGHGEAIYEIGVEDSGMLAGVTKEEVQSSLTTIQRMAEKLDAETSIIREKCIEATNETRYAVEILVRKIPDEQEFVDVRLAVLGNVDVGKSTLLGVLTTGECDNGRGRARLNLFRHLHEIQTGRTSSISHEILGFDSSGQVINYGDSSTAEDICATASKLVTFIDLAGHHKYMKTTIFGLTGYSPDAVMLVVSASSGIVGTTKEHLGLAIALKLPTVVVITKVDICSSATTDRVIQQIERILKSPGCNKMPMVVETEDDATVAAGNFSNGQITPIFKVSSVTGQNLDVLKMFLYLVPPSNSKGEQEKLFEQPAEFQVDEVFFVPNVGPVVAGTLIRGTMKEGDQLFIGPTEYGEYFPVNVLSLQRNRAPCRLIKAGHTASVALSDVDRPFLRRGLVMLEPSQQQYCCMEFEAEVFLLFHTTSISRRFQATVHIGNVIQTAKVVELNKDSIRTGQRAKIRFKFIKQPEYIKIGARLLLREGRTKGIGEITQVFHYVPEKESEVKVPYKSMTVAQAVRSGEFP